MQKNYSFFESKVTQFVAVVFSNSTPIMGSVFNKNKFQRFFVLIFLLLSISGYSQLTLENFSGGIPGTWAVTSNLTVTNNWAATPAGGYLASPGAFVNPALNNTQGSTAEYFMITPQFLTPTNGEIRFYTKQGSFTNKGATYQLRISTANQPDVSSFNVVLQSWTEAQLNVAATTYEEKVVPIPTIPAGIPVYVAFVAITNQTGTSATSGDSWFVDNVRVIAGCAPVTGITSSVTATSAQIDWTHPVATQFNIDVVPTGAGHSGNGTPVTGTTYTATPLNPSSTYDVYIMSNCDATTSSTWAGPFSFTTAAIGLSCPTAIPVPSDITTTPYIYNNNLAQFYDANTYVPMTSQGLSCIPPAIPSTWNLLEGNHAYFSYTPSTTGLINIKQAITISGATNNCYNASSSVFVFNSCAGVGTSAGCLGSMVTDSNLLTNTMSNFYVTAGNTYIIIVSSPYQHTNPGAGMCFTLTISGSTCPAPAVITYNNLQQTSITASWNNVQNLMNAWEYIALPFTSGNPAVGQTGTATSTNTNNLVSGLSPGTKYNLFVRSVCGGTPGPWSSPMVFTTQCTPLPTPYYTGFTSASTDSPEPCWTILNLNNDVVSFTYGNNAYSEPCARLRTSGYDQVTDDMLISPQFTFDGVTQKRLRFKFMAYGSYNGVTTTGDSTFEVRLSTSGVGASDFTTVILPLQTYFTGFNWVEKIVVIPANIVGNVNVAWKLPLGTTQTSTQFYVDDVYVEDLPACSSPQYPAITPGSITSTSAQLSWTNGYNTSQWEVIAQPLNTGIPAANATNGVLVSTNPYTYTGLIPSTRYEFYVRSYCDATHQSEWIGPVPFNTVCIAQFSPYHESFNDTDINTKKFCWTIKNPANDIAQWRISATEASIQPQGTFSTPFTTYDDWLVSVPINVSGFKRLHYSIRAATSPFYPTARGAVEVLMSTTSDFSTYTTLIPSHEFTNTGYEEESVLFTGSGTYYIAFRIPPTMSDPSGSGIVMIDDVIIDDAPACPNPTNLLVNSTNTTTANLSWTPGYTETQWQIVIQSPLSGLPTGSGTTVNTFPNYQASGLTQDTAYEYYVRAYCNSTDQSSWIGPIPFRTTCDPLPTPFTETFDSNSTTESCWTIANSNNDSDFWNLNETANAMFGNQMAALFTGNNGDNNDWLITPTLMAHANQRIRFHYRTLSNSFEEDLKVMLSTNGTTTSQFSTILYENNLTTPTDATGTVANSNTITVASNQGIRIGDVVYIPGFPIPYGTTVTDIQSNVITLSDNATITQSGIQNVTFTHETINNTTPKEMVINLTDITSPTNINIGFYIPFYPPNPWNYRGQFLFIDNVIVEDIPSCPSVINVTTQDIIDTSVKIDWQPTGTETAWEISVQPYGTPAPIGNTLPGYLFTTTSHPKTITGLIPSSHYQYYIRSVCSGTSQSEWIGPFEFITKCDYSNVCQYTMSVSNGSTGHVYESVEVRQNGVTVQTLTFPYTGTNQPTVIDYEVFLCRGVEYSLYFNAGGGSGVQYSQAQVVIKDESNATIWTSPLGLGTAYTNIFTAVANCGVVTCVQPTNVVVNNQGTFSWTPGGSETQWEVFIQPVINGTIPQSGTIVNSPTYTPVAADFVNAAAGTYEFFVRAICGPSDKSFWTGPKPFIRNDESNTALHLPVNTGSTCDASGIDASFIGATVSNVPTTCSGTNDGDIWYDFVATSKVHIIELSDFTPGTYYASSYQGAWPKIMMTLYEVQSDGSLLEKGCSEDNSMVTSYSKELVVGHTYKIRLTLNDPVTTDKKFHICITTPDDICEMDAFNYDFEKLPMQYVTGISTIINARVIPGWRVNTDWGTMFFQEGSNSSNVYPYSGGQCLQLTQDGAAAWDPNDPNIKGMYRDFDTTEITQMKYSFASASRSNGTTLQLFAGPPAGPFTLITEDFANSLVWELIAGTYSVPVGQTTTRFIFRVKDNAIGHVIDVANFKPNVDINVDSIATTLSCETTSTVVSAEGIGTWVADDANPAATVIADPTAKTTTISGFHIAGVYTYHWKTRYCDKTVTITYQSSTEVASVSSPVTYCKGATATALQATPPSGDTLLWYTSSTGGVGSATAPTPITTTTGNTSYFVSVVNSLGCEGPRTEIVSTVNPLPTATISGTTSICTGGTATITFSGTPNAEITYTLDGGSNQTITLGGTGSATITTPILATTSTYTLVSVVNTTTSCSQTQTGSAVITVNPLPTATISGTTSICAGSNTTISFSGTPNANVTYTVNGGSNQIITLNGAGLATLTTPTLTGNTTYALVSATNTITSCSQAQTGSAVITVNPLPTATISGTTTLCSGGTASVTFTGTANATVTYTINGGSNQTILLDGAGQATITTPSLTGNSTYALVSVLNTTTSCSQLQTGSAVITVNPLPTVTISGTTTICSGSTTTINFSGTPNATVLYTINGGSNQTITLDGSGLATLTTPTLTGTSTYTLVSVTNTTTLCNQTQTGTVVVTVNPLPTATISGTTTLCSGGTANITFTGTPSSTVTYTVNGGTNQTIVLDSAGLATLTTPTLTGNSIYALVNVVNTTTSCSQTQTGTAVITINSLSTVILSGSTSICTGGTATITFTGTPDSTVTYTVDGGSNQTILLNGSGLASITTPALNTNSTYTLVSVTNTITNCSQLQTGTATITVGILPTVAISGTTSLCSGSTTTISFTGTPNATVTYTINGGSSQSITLNGTGTAQLTTSALTVDTIYALVDVTVGTLACSQSQTGSAIITINPLPTAAISGTASICTGTSTVITFTGTPNATVLYSIDGNSNQSIVLDGSGNASITTPVLTTNSTYALVSVTAAGTLACSQLQTGSAIITINGLPTATISGSTSICSGSTAVITFTGTPNSVVTYTVDGGSNQTILVNSSGTATITTPALTVNSTYTLVSITNTATTCNQSQTGTAVITVSPLPTATISGTTTICSGGTTLITFTGTPNATVIYTINGGSNQTIVLDGTGVATLTTAVLTTTTTYALVTVSATLCSQSQTGTAIITVNPLPTATISGTTTLCTGNTATITFTGTPNATVTYTINGGSNQTLNLNASGSATVTTAALTANTTYALVSVVSTTTSCSQTLTGTATITINALATPNTSFSYVTTCLNSTINPSPVLTTGFVTGGVFSSATLTVNSATGVVDLSTATAGTHQITYTVSQNTANCTAAGTYTASIVLSSGITPVTSFSYATPYCANSSNALPTLATGFYAGGIYSSTTGLNINSATGEINFTQSVPGTYTVHYTVAVNSANCNLGGNSSFEVIILNPLSFTLDDLCKDQMLHVQVVPTTGSFTTSEANYHWNIGSTAVGSNTELFNVDEYMSQNPLVNLPLTIGVSVEVNGCTYSDTITILENTCRMIPKGISPNNDQMNDTFDLSGLGVKELNIFNRYGSKVYSFNGNYTDQWGGKSDAGSDLPDGTYFYFIRTNGGSTVTGWVYINREY